MKPLEDQIRLTHIGSDTTITRMFSGRPARGVYNTLLEKSLHSNLKPLPWPFQPLAADDIYLYSQTHNNADYFPLLAGQSSTYAKERSNCNRDSRRDNVRSNKICYETREII